MTNRFAALVCIASIALATLACTLSGWATPPPEDIGTRVALVLTQTALAATQTALVQPTEPAIATETAVPAETPAPPAATAGTISGRLCYPSEGIPPLTLFAREVNTQNTVSIQTAENQGQYVIEVPAPGTYIVFAYAEIGVGGTYSPAVACGLTVDCTDHAPIQMDVQPGTTVTGADICDYYGPPGFIPANPNAAIGTIMGNLCYPSEGIPPLTVYAREVNTNQTHTIQTGQNQGQYSIEVPAPGTYIVFAYTDFGIGGSYSQAVLCGLTADCNDHSPIQIPLTAGATASGADICDYYGPEGSVPAP